MMKGFTMLNSPSRSHHAEENGRTEKCKGTIRTTHVASDQES